VTRGARSYAHRPPTSFGQRRRSGCASLQQLRARLRTDQLGEAVFRNPSTESWETDYAYLSGSVRTKLALAEAATEQDPQYARNVAALRLVQPEDLRPSDITAKLGAPWILAADIKAFALDIMGTAARVRHTAETGRRGNAIVFA
jgi:N12 class adenine-specific DNA methylase